jgi:hypothetical protein
VFEVERASVLELLLDWTSSDVEDMAVVVCVEYCYGLVSWCCRWSVVVESVQVLLSLSSRVVGWLVIGDSCYGIQETLLCK